MKWVETTFGEFVDCNPMIKCKRNCLVENCEMEDIDANFRYLYPQQGKVYTGSGSKFQNGDTVFSRITPCLENGKIAQIKGLKGNVGVGSTEFFVFRGKANVSYNDFVYYLANSRYIRKSAENSMAGASGRQRADLNFIKSRTIRVPEKVEDQKRIASILSHYDDLIEINKRRIALLEESARELYKEWFVRMRFPGWRKEKTTAGIPSEWEIKNISQICDISAGKDRPEQVSPAKSKEFPYPIYSNGVDNNGLYGFASSPRVANNCITISARGTIGFVVLHLFPFVPIVRLLVLVPQKENLLYYLYLWAKCIPIEGNGTSQQQLTVPMIGKEKIIIPTEEILDQFNTYINELVGIKDNLIHANELLSLQRDRLLPRLMSGQLEV